MSAFNPVKAKLDSIIETTGGRVAIVIVIALVLMFVWSRVEGLAPNSKDRIFGIIPSTLSVPIRRTY